MKKGALTSEQATGFLRFLPRTTQLIEMSGSAAGVNEAAALALLGKDFNNAHIPGETESDSETDSRETESSANRRAERYSRLDARFDRDVDDTQTKTRKLSPLEKKSETTPNRPSAAARLDPILKAVTSYATMARGRSEVGRPFVGFERAVILEMNTPPEKNALERVVTNEMLERFLVAGINPQLAWQDEGGVRFLAQTLIGQGPAYGVSGKYLVLASSRDYARDILTAAAAPATAPNRVEGAVEYYALVRIGQAKPIFDKLMAKLDGKTSQTPGKNSNEEGEGQEVKFFSDNISSFLAATSIREVRLRRIHEGTLMTERVTYSW
jgi:hypothetical protein